MSLRYRRWRTPTRKSILLTVLAAVSVSYWFTRPGPEFVIPPYEVGGKLAVIVTDENDERIANASVLSNGLRAIQEPGTWYGWDENEHGQPVALTTDEDGLVELPYPKWVDRKTGLLTEFVPIIVEHPEFCSTSDFECEVPKPGKVTPLTRVRLHRGGRFRMKAYRQGQPEPIKDFHWYCSDDMHHRSTGWETDDGRRLSPVFPAGDHVLRVVDNADPESLQFSDPITFKAVAGQIDDLEVHLRPTMTVKGKLDCPTPVKNGYAVAHVIDSITDSITGSYHHARWETWVHVAENGGFEFRTLPQSGTVSVLAWCDRFYNEQPVVETIPPHVIGMKDIRSLPQFFTLNQEPYFCLVKMIPTSTCEVSVTNSYGLPIEDVDVQFFPNTTYDGRGSLIFGTALRFENIRLEAELPYLERMRAFEKQWNDPQECLRPRFGGKTDEKGQIPIPNLVGRGSQSLWVNHEQWIVRGGSRPPFDANVRADIQPGKTAKVSLVMVPKPKLTPKMLKAPSSKNPLGFLQPAVDWFKNLFE